MVVQGHRVSSVAELSRPGDFFIEKNDINENANFFYKCPCGCNGRHEFSNGVKFELIYIATGEKKSNYWKWDGDEDKPTLSPSIFSKKERGGCGWHGFLEHGSWRSV